MTDFLGKYDTLIFDMDGVVTSESGYWDAAALTVREFLTSKKYFGDSDIDTVSLSENVKAIRNEVFLGDKLISLLKGKGVNSNWDLGYIMILMALILDTDDAQKIYDFADSINEDIIVAYDTLARKAAKKTGALFSEYERNGKLWCEMQDCFQAWYLGDDMFMETYPNAPNTPNKPGLYKQEQPIISLDELKTVLCTLSATKRLGIATGRLRREIVPLLEQWGVLDCFDENSLCTYDYVITGEESMDTTLTKPHPYMFLKALYGLDYDDKRIIDGDYDKSEIESTLIIGDAGADILAAHTMHADFCAVLTGVSGQDGRQYFEEQNSKYILNDIRDFL